MVFPCVLVIDEPIIDLIKEVDDEFLKAYGVEDGEITRYNPEVHGDLYEVLKADKSTIVLPGGNAQNTARVCQALSPYIGRTGFMGAIGQDSYGSVMAQEAEACGMACDYTSVSGEMTSRCAVLVNNRTRERTMVTDLGASNQLREEHLDMERIEAAKVIFCGGFMAFSQASMVTKLAKTIAERPEQVWATSLGAPFVVTMCSSVINEWLQLANMVVGNESEWKAYARDQKWNEEMQVQEIIKRVCEEVPWKCGDRKSRIVIATQGPKPTLVAYRSNAKAATSLQEYLVKEVPTEQVVDTNGCGDGFAGGFLYGWSRGATLAKCVRIGQVCGREVLRNNGAVFDLREYSKKLNAEIDEWLVDDSALAQTTTGGSSTSETESELH